VLCLLRGTNGNVNVIWVHLHCVYSELKCRIRQRPTHEGPDREKSSTISLTSALDRDGWLTARPGSFTPKINPVSTVQVAGWAPGPVWTATENLAPNGILIPGLSYRFRVVLPTTLSRPTLPSGTKQNVNVISGKCLVPKHLTPGIINS
jgi:hypothetical protein